MACILSAIVVASARTSKNPAITASDSQYWRLRSTGLSLCFSKNLTRPSAVFNGSSGYRHHNGRRWLSFMRSVLIVLPSNIETSHARAVPRDEAADDTKFIPSFMSGIATRTPPNTICGMRVNGTTDIALSPFVATAEISSPIPTPFHAANSIASNRPAHDPCDSSISQTVASMKATCTAVSSISGRSLLNRYASSRRLTIRSRR